MELRNYALELALEKRIHQVYPAARVRTRALLYSGTYAVRVVNAGRSAMLEVSPFVLKQDWTWAIDSTVQHVLRVFAMPKQWKRMRAH